MIYTTEITRTIETLTKVKLYQVPCLVSAGERQHKTKKEALKHVNFINAKYGEGTARYLGKAV